MGIDPDIQPLLDALNERITTIEERDLETPISENIELRLSILEAKLQRVVSALTDTPVEEPLPTVDLPDGYTLMGDLTHKRGDEAGAWEPTNNIVMTTWMGGAGTTGDPSLVEWEDNGSVTLSYENAGQRAGVLQFNQPKYTKGRIGAVIEVLGVNAVCAFFTYGNDSKEFDFELGKVNEVPTWIIGIHMPKNGGGTVHSEKTYVPLKNGAHIYEIEHGANYVAFFIDSEEVARFTPEDVPDSVWSTSTEMAPFFSVEHHGGWAGWTEADYSTNKGKMRVYGFYSN